MTHSRQPVSCSPAFLPSCSLQQTRLDVVPARVPVMVPLMELHHANSQKVVSGRCRHRLATGVMAVCVDAAHEAEEEVG